MKKYGFRPTALGAALALSAVAVAGQSIIKDLSVPEYDAAGHLRWRLNAVSAVGTFEDPKLNEGQVELYDDHAGDAPLVGVLSFAEAIYHRKRSEIEGGRHLRYRAAQGTLDGEGFTYGLSDRHLHINSQVVLQSPSTKVTSERADAVLAENATGAIIGITSAKLLGHVAVTRAPEAKHSFDRAETESAVYTGSDGMLELKAPVTTWTNGNKAVLNSPEIKIFIGALPNLAGARKPVAAPSHAYSPAGSDERMPRTGLAPNP